MRRTKLAPTSKTKRAALVRKLDALTRKIVFRDQENKCVCCGSTDKLQLGHIFSRTTYSTRWDFKEGGNCTIQCSGCNLRHEFDTVPLFRWYINKFGQEKFDELYARYKSVTPVKTYEMEEWVILMEEEANG